jgi:hypothetical protein
MFSARKYLSRTQRLTYAGNETLFSVIRQEIIIIFTTIWHYNHLWVFAFLAKSL